MNRRDFANRLALGSIPATLLLAGCGSATESITGGLEVTGVEARSTDFGNVVMAVRVENTATEPKSGTLVGQVDLDGGDVYTESRNIRVPGEDYNDFRLEFDIGLGDSLSADSYTYEAWLE